MRLKTYIAIYLLILAVLFSSVGMVSFYLTRSQIEMLTNKSEGQFQAISGSLARDITAIYSRGGGANAVQDVVRGYAHYYRRHNVDIHVSAGSVPNTVMNLHAPEIHIVGSLPGDFFYVLNYSLDISENIASMRDIQSMLLLSAVIFSGIAAVALHFILSALFRPLVVVAKTSRKIAGGNFGERIPVSANNELAQVAHDFNKMAERIEQQIETLEAEAENKQQFVDNFAHEMRTPLTSIFGYAEYMQKAPLNEGELIDFSGRIMHKASYLQGIASSLLQLAMLREYSAEMNEISVPRLFDDIARTLKGEFDAAGIEFSREINAQTLHGQGDLIKCLLLNLCQNALRACADSSAGTIKMSAQHDATGITLSVSDNGCGIPQASLSKVTEPFYRADKARKNGGAGLGLTLCRKIAEVHGAELRISSEVGVGTRVAFVSRGSAPHPGNF